MPDKIIGNVTGMKGKLHESIVPDGLDYEIVKVSGGMEKNQYARVKMTKDGIEWEVEYENDSRANVFTHLWRNREKVNIEAWIEADWQSKVQSQGPHVPAKTPEWVPGWFKSISDEPDGIDLIAWLCIADACHRLSREAGMEPEEDDISYNIDSTGQVEVYQEEGP